MRFLIAVIGLWVAGRAAFVTGWREKEAGIPVARTRTPDPGGGPVASGEGGGPPPAPERRVEIAGTQPLLPSAPHSPAMATFAPRPTPVEPRESAPASVPSAGDDRAAAPPVSAGPPVPAPAGPPAALAASPASAAPRAPRRWSGSTWLFARGAGGTSLAGGGQLGGSQAGARIAYAVDGRGGLAVAARAYASLDHPRESEAAVGIDLRPIPDIAFRLSAERRVPIGAAGRSAWSLYAAGGFFKGLPGDIELDGYAQAGVVGASRRDLFADGALRIARRVAVGRSALLAGAGLWGAAQPGAERLDLGPRVALRVPAGGATLSMAVDGRLRVAGDAAPGSGAALTLSADF